jgi:hypothetical protein
MLRILKQVRAATALLKPEDIRARSNRPVNIGLVASSGAAYAEMEEFLIPSGISREERLQVLGHLHRAGDPDAAHDVDLVLYEHGVPSDRGTYVFNREYPETTVEEILKQHDELALALARQFPAFRRPVVDHLIQEIARENALFAIATALPNVLPNLMELPWALGEFASDTMFLTANQVRLAFLIAAASGNELGFASQKAEILSIAAGAFGWRALARELVGKIPLGGGLLPKGAIAYAGTILVGKGLEYFLLNRSHYTAEQRETVYHEALEKGKTVAETLRGYPV